jgi:hypothetical protein
MFTEARPVQASSAVRPSFCCEQNCAVRQPARITLSGLRFFNDVFGDDRPGSGRVLVGTVGRSAGLHSMPCVLEGMCQKTYRLGVEHPFGIQFDEAPHGLNLRLNDWRERSAFPFAAVPRWPAVLLLYTHLIILTT